MPATGIVQREFLAGGRKFGKPKTKRNDEIHIVLRPVLVIGQLIGVFPLYGVFTDERQKIRFVLRSVKTLLSLFMISFTATMTGMAFWRLKTDKVVSNRILSDIMFFGSTCISMIFFMRLATNWKPIIDEWHKVEEFMVELKPVKIARRILILTVAFMTMSILEHVLAHLEAIFHPRKEINILKEMMVAVRVVATMAWNFPDLFIMAISLALSSKYQQLSKEIESVRHRTYCNPSGMYPKNFVQEKPLEYWKKTRENFNRLSVLTKTLDEALSPIILMSFTNNLFFICLQLLNSLKPMQSVYKVIYFYLSFGHILFRTSAVCLTASNVYDNSRAPLSALFSVSSDTFNIEVQRLVEQISFDTPAFTGCKFFTITRSLILTLAGTIVTYEIVLVQFNALTSDTMTTDTLENDL